MVNNQSVKQAPVVIMMLAMKFAFLIQAVFVGKQRGIKIAE